MIDPNQTLQDARTACRHWIHGDRGDHDLVAFDELVNAFLALDQWLMKGGYPPNDWVDRAWKTTKGQSS